MSPRVRAGIIAACLYVVVGWAYAVAAPTHELPRAHALAAAPVAALAIAGAFALWRSSRR